MATQWFFRERGAVIGPLTPAALKEAARIGRLKPASGVRREGDAKWFLAKEVVGLFDVSAPAADVSPTSVPLKNADEAAAAPNAPVALSPDNAPERPAATIAAVAPDVVVAPDATIDYVPPPSPHSMAAASSSGAEPAPATVSPGLSADNAPERPAATIAAVAPDVVVAPDATIDYVPPPSPHSMAAASSSGAEPAPATVSPGLSADQFTSRISWKAMAIVSVSTAVLLATVVVPALFIALLFPAGTPETNVVADALPSQQDSAPPEIPTANAASNAETTGEAPVTAIEATPRSGSRYPPEREDESSEANLVGTPSEAAAAEAAPTIPQASPLTEGENASLDASEVMDGDVEPAGPADSAIAADAPTGAAPIEGEETTRVKRGESFAQSERFKDWKQQVTAVHEFQIKSRDAFREQEQRRVALTSDIQALQPDYLQLAQIVAKCRTEIAFIERYAAQKYAQVENDRILAQREAKSKQQQGQRPMGPVADYLSIDLQRRYLGAQTALAEYGPQLERISLQLEQLQSEVAIAQRKQAHALADVDGAASAWMHLCDPFGTLGDEERGEVMRLLTGWIEEEPDLAYTYLGRAFAGMPSTNTALVESDLKEVERLEPRLSVLTQPLRGYLLTKAEADPKPGLLQLNLAMKVSRKAWLPLLLRGKVYLELGDYRRAKDDLEQALKFGGDAAHVNESLAYLLACCPDDALRSGKRAKTLAAKACDLTKWKDWRAIDVLGAACAETGDFDEAAKHIDHAIDLAAVEFVSDLEARLTLYRSQQPYRLPATAKPRR